MRLFIAGILLLANFVARADSGQFNPQSLTYQISVTTSASTPVQVAPVASGALCFSYAVSNTGNTDAWVRFASAAIDDVPAIPAPGTPANSTLVMAGTIVGLQRGDKQFVSAITASGSTTLNVQCGVGTEIYSTGSSIISGSVTSTPSPYVGTFTNKSGTVTTGGTSQTMAAVNATRKGMIIQNPITATTQGIAAAESLFINFTTAASTSAGASIELEPGGSMTILGCCVTGEAITVTAATTGHKFTAKELN